jgi:plasminogen activator inhibitor 1 RNA-binding protein
MASEEAKEGFDATVPPPVDADGSPLPGDAEDQAPAEAAPPEREPEPEDNSKSYADYVAEQAAKRPNFDLEPRKPNEGSKMDKKWANAKPLNKDDEDDSYIAGQGAKSKAKKERKEKNTIDIDMRFQETRSGDRGRGRGRGDFRGDRARGGRGRGRGDDFRGSSYRGRGRGDAVNVADTKAFPSLGGGP